MWLIMVTILHLLNQLQKKQLLLHLKTSCAAEKNDFNCEDSKKAETQTGKPIYYTIKSGDSLYSIAIKYKTTVPKICALNGIKAKDILSIGKS